MKKTNKDPKVELKKIMFISLALLIVFVILYFIAYLIIQGKEKQNPDIPTEFVQYDEILISNIGKQNESNYYVLVYLSEENYQNFYSKYLAIYNGNLKMYYANVNNAFNKSYKGDSFAYDLNNGLKISEDVLLEIKNGNIVNNYTGKASILEKIVQVIGI